MPKPPNEVLNITVRNTPLGMKWTLRIASNPIAGGYAKNMWAALDDTNAALLKYVQRLGVE